MIRLIIIFVVSLLAHFLIAKRCRDYLMPWAFGVMVFWQSVAHFFGGFHAHYIFVTLYFLGIGILLASEEWARATSKPTFRAFSVLAIYYSVASIWGDYKFDCFMNCCIWYFEVILPAYALGRWMMDKEGRLGVIMRVATLFCFLIVLIYSRTNAFESPSFTGAEAKGGGRLSMEVEDGIGDFIAPNAMGMMTAVLMLYPLLNFFQTSNRHWLCNIINRAISWAGIGCLMAFGVILIKTGSRNAALSLFPMGGYLLFGQWGGARMMKRIAVKVFVILAVVLCAFYAFNRYLSDLTEIRSFSLQEQTGKDFGSGRIYIFEQLIGQMKEYEWIIGAGAAPHINFYVQGPIMTAFQHNSYVQLFVQSGAIGVSLFLCFLVVFFRTSRNVFPALRHIAYLMFFVWFLVGMGESFGFIQMIAIAKYHMALAIAICDGGLIQKRRQNFLI